MRVLILANVASLASVSLLPLVPMFAMAKWTQTRTRWTYRGRHRAGQVPGASVQRGMVW